LNGNFIISSCLNGLMHGCNDRAVTRWRLVHQNGG
jgi:hypothetical protein